MKVEGPFGGLVEFVRIGFVRGHRIGVRWIGRYFEHRCFPVGGEPERAIGLLGRGDDLSPLLLDTGHRESL
ncbi:hypothetical protein CUN63_31425 [Pseudomonas sp. ACM7]|nr:hypothetical protein CUN63_31425 [Pseudomonas sp. ACM7]